MVTYRQLQDAMPGMDVHLVARAFYRTGQLVSEDWWLVWLNPRDDRRTIPLTLTELAILPEEHINLINDVLLPKLVGSDLMCFYLGRLAYQISVSTTTPEGFDRRLQSRYPKPEWTFWDKSTRLEFRLEWPTIMRRHRWFNALAYCWYRFKYHTEKMWKLDPEKARDQRLERRNFEKVWAFVQLDCVPLPVINYFQLLLATYHATGRPEITLERALNHLDSPWRPVPVTIGEADWILGVDSHTMTGLKTIVGSYAAGAPTDTEVMLRLAEVLK